MNISIHIRITFLNLSREEKKFMCNDKVCENINLESEVRYNLNDSWSTGIYHRERVHSNLFSIKDLRKCVIALTGTSICGSKHTNINNLIDIKQIVEIILEERILKKH